MIKLIAGNKGAGKTKILLDAIGQARSTSNGNVVAIQVGNALSASVTHEVRLINVEDYKVHSCEAFYGFISGILASDYDCTHIFVDGTLRIVGRNMSAVSAMLDGINAIAADTEVVFTISAEKAELPEAIQKYI